MCKDCANCKHSLDIENDNILECSLDGNEYEVDHACNEFEEE